MSAPYKNLQRHQNAMYQPSHFNEPDQLALRELIHAYPFGAWILHRDDGLEINHLPFLFDTNDGPCGALIGHVARANPAWQHVANTSTTVIFNGPHGYISPSWYPSKQEHHRAVPTWNYAVVHAHGVAEAIEDKPWLLNLVARLTNVHEATNSTPWRVTDAPTEYVDKMLGAIVGIRIKIETLEGKFKLNQNRSQADQLGAIDGLESATASDAKQLAAFMRKRYES